MSAIMRRLRLGKWRYFQGYDLEGNAYFARPNPQARDPADPRTMKRVVEYAEEKPMWAYQGNELSVQWAAWLRRTREEPPTLEELQADQIRTLRLRDNVARLKLEYAAEKDRLKLSQQQNISRASALASPSQPPPPPPPVESQAATPDSESETDKHEAARSSVAEQQPLRQQEPLEDAERPGARALKNSPFNRTSENPDASWQPSAAAPKPLRRR